MRACEYQVFSGSHLSVAKNDGRKLYLQQYIISTVIKLYCKDSK